MKDNCRLHEFPTKRIKPFDGMAVTAQVWQEAHNYHDERRRFHDLLSHGAGIVCGLEVIANDPPDSTVFVKPGVATDSLGRQIVVAEPVGFDIGHTTDGALYLLLNYAEGDAQEENNPEAATAHLVAGFGMEVQNELPDTPSVELARIRREGREEPIHDARDGDLPDANEIDLRFRISSGMPDRAIVSAALCTVGGDGGGPSHVAGLRHLVRAFNRSGLPEARFQVRVDQGVLLGGDLTNCLFVYVVATGEFELTRDEMESLYNYLQVGGTVVVETCCQDIVEGEAPAKQSITRLVGDLGMELEVLSHDCEMLTNPYVFGAPPAGFEDWQEGEILSAQGLIVSTVDYGCLWEGKRRGRPANREEIRSAFEWGSNIVTYAIKRRSQRNGE
ncbi:MAG: DUF4159 domain-containing protein [Anaerolineae bacterium]|nr:DUF4159 domain-containing protein [Anaerolineae bacterium]